MVFKVKLPSGARFVPTFTLKLRPNKRKQILNKLTIVVIFNTFFEIGAIFFTDLESSVHKKIDDVTIMLFVFSIFLIAGSRHSR